MARVLFLMAGRVTGVPAFGSVLAALAALALRHLVATGHFLAVLCLRGVPGVGIGRGRCSLGIGGRHRRGEQRR